MTDSFQNVYDDRARADSYSTLEFPGTYYLAFRDLPELIAKFAVGRKALDFGCGAGRSTRFLKSHGLDASGIDISEAMLLRARERDPQGVYELVPDGDLSRVPSNTYDLILSAFTSDNIPDTERKVHIFRDLRRALRPGGCIVNLVSSPEIYTHEWASFTTKDFPANRAAKGGDRVHIVMLDVPDRRPVEDILFTESDYANVYERAGLTVRTVHRPLGRDTDPVQWVSEKTVAPWRVDVLGR